MLAALLLSFGVIFVAELGDKSQLMAMTFALKYRWWVVIGGITLATTVVHLMSVAVGHSLGVALPTHLIGIVGGVAFLVFGLWTLRGDSLDEEEKSKADRVTKSAFIAVASAFFLAELGDKTMLATVTLASDNDWVGVWIGSTLGMVAADALAIVVGATLGKRLPERLITLGAATLFFVFGVWLILEGVFPTSSIGIVGAVVVLAVGSALTTWRMRKPAPAAVESEESAPSGSR
ncbi:TMEM165/GDT1 family protein [Rhodococcoides kroppenstedtii]|uniref:TMEM165/GDT1 family protein n=1 Tax=Rhodococcoides kroppenstedtii TaxID=293050 RepID=UPI001C9A510C|nr:TMEM165/GDT1 family protein [Rhodococcus kroppenstedtii]MBY6438559.1 TMEM165/GDT1 family protein [Rhodococcus kroppenstedtii]